MNIQCICKVHTCYASKNKIGPNIAPWGTQLSTKTGFKDLLPRFTRFCKETFSSWQLMMRFRRQQSCLFVFTRYIRLQVKFQVSFLQQRLALKMLTPLKIIGLLIKRFSESWVLNTPRWTIYVFLKGNLKEINNAHCSIWICWGLD